MAYVSTATRAIAAGGSAVTAAFASDGPQKCSGLPGARREPHDIAGLFGEHFELIDSRRELHATPSGGSQAFVYALLRKKV